VCNVDAAFTLSAVANLARDLNFDGASSGNVYAQPLYIEGGPNGPMIIAVTESNNVYALNATSGTLMWQRTNIGPPVTSGLPCGNSRSSSLRRGSTSRQHKQSVF
jgi:outer membrane protein assembly factor BamB